MSSSTSKTSLSDSEVGTSAQFSSKRGTTLASKRKGAFEPPQGAVLMSGPDDDTGVLDTEEFDWNSVKDEDIELWLVRVPNSVRLFPTTERGTSIECFSPKPCLLSEIFCASRSNPNISAMPFSMLPPRRPRILLVRSRRSTRHTTSGLLVTGTTMTSITTRLAATR